MFKRMMNTVLEYMTKVHNIEIDKEEDLPVSIPVSIKWASKTLQNWKSIITCKANTLTITECTYNGDKDELYFDMYKKWDSFSTIPPSNVDIHDKLMYAVKEYANEHIDSTDRVISSEDVYVVWSDGDRAMISTSLHDGMYYECEYRKHVNTVYVTAYKKYVHEVFEYYTTSSITNKQED